MKLKPQQQDQQDSYKQEIPRATGLAAGFSNPEAKEMSEGRSTCVVSMPARNIENGASQEPSEPARVLDFAKPDVPAKSEEGEKSSTGLTRSQKIRRIVESAIDKMDDNQLEALVIAIEEITGCHRGGDSENDGA